MYVVSTDTRGRKGKIGSVQFHNGRLAFFAGYHDCVCGKQSKILLDVDDVRELGKLGNGSPRVPLGAKIVRRLAAHYAA